jgi:hypothetical protein
MCEDGRGCEGANLRGVEEMADEGQKQKKKKKKETEKKLEFEVGKVFGPEAAKDEDLSLNVDTARYKAQKGQGGDRKKNES